MSGPDYAALRTARSGTGRGPYRQFPEQTAMERRRELSRRSAIARTRALGALARLHPADYAVLAAAARIEVDAERGSLPGDES